jgi:sialic acid synthase SpsE
VNKPVLVSQGCMDGDEQPAISFDNCSFLYLHCVAAYPPPVGEMNLSVLSSGNYSGLSDHSANVLTGGFATCLGAEIIEVHFRLKTTPCDNPDYRHSHLPDGLREYIQNIRTAEQMLGDGIKKIEKSEEALMKHRVTT